jgi:hypothetical protein
MRGESEGGITPGLAVVANAIVDALAEFGIETSSCLSRRSAFGRQSGTRAAKIIERDRPNASEVR